MKNYLSLFYNFVGNIKQSNTDISIENETFKLTVSKTNHVYADNKHINKFYHMKFINDKKMWEYVKIQLNAYFNRKEKLR